MAERKIIILLVSVLFLFSSCDWSNKRDNPHEPLDSWTSSQRPVVVAAAEDELTFSWHHIQNASLYSIYAVNIWGPPVNETLVASTEGNSLTFAADTYDSSRIYRVQAFDDSMNRLSCSILQGYLDQIVPGYALSPCSDNFEEGVVPDEKKYALRKTGSSPAPVIADGKLLIDCEQGESRVYLGYDGCDNVYTRITLSVEQKYVSGMDFSCGCSISAFENNLNGIIIGNSVFSGIPQAGTELYAYDMCDYSPERVNKALESPPFFNETIERIFQIDHFAGEITVVDNGISTRVKMPFQLPQKLVFCFFSWSAGVGDGISIDSLHVESSDIPF